MNTDKIFFGWWIVLGCAVIMAATCGIALNSIPVAYQAMAETYGFKMGAVAMTTSIAALAAMFSAVIVGKLMEKIKLRILMTVCGILYCSGLIGYSFSSTLAHFYLFSIIIGIGFAGTYLIPISVIITNWFDEKRGLALAIAFAGTGIGAMIFGPLMNQMITTIGLSKMFLTVGIISAILILPITLFFLRLTPEEMGLFPYGQSETKMGEDGNVFIEDGLTLKQAFKSPCFWLLALGVFLWSTATMGVQNHIPSYLKTIGYTATFAAGIFAAVNGILMLGKLAIGEVADRFGIKNSMYYIFGTGFLAMILMLFAKNHIIVYAYAGFAGLAAAIMTVPVALWTVEILGKKEFPIIYSIMNIFLTLGVALGPPISGFIFDFSNTYIPAIFTWIIVLAVSLILTLAAYNKRPQITAL